MPQSALTSTLPGRRLSSTLSSNSRGPRTCELTFEAPFFHGCIPLSFSFSTYQWLSSASCAGRRCRSGVWLLPFLPSPSPSYVSTEFKAQEFMTWTPQLLVIDAGSMAQVIVEEFSLLTWLGHACGFAGLLYQNDEEISEYLNSNHEAVETGSVATAPDHSASGSSKDHPPLLTSKPLYIGIVALLLFIIVLILQFLVSPTLASPQALLFLQFPGAALISSLLPSPSSTATATSIPSTTLS